MGKMRKVKGPDGRTIEVTEVDFVTSREEFNEYLLQDGRVLKVKSVLTAVFDVPGQRSNRGGRAVAIETSNIVITDEFEEPKQ